MNAVVNPVSTVACGKRTAHAHAVLGAETGQMNVTANLANSVEKCRNIVSAAKCVATMLTNAPVKSANTANIRFMTAFAKRNIAIFVTKL